MDPALNLLQPRPRSQSCLPPPCLLAAMARLSKTLPMPLSRARPKSPYSLLRWVGLALWDLAPTSASPHGTSWAITCAALARRKCCKTRHEPACSPLISVLLALLDLPWHAGQLLRLNKADGSLFDRRHAHPKRGSCSRSPDSHQWRAGHRWVRNCAAIHPTSCAVGAGGFVYCFSTPQLALPPPTHPS